MPISWELIALGAKFLYFKGTGEGAEQWLCHVPRVPGVSAGAVVQEGPTAGPHMMPPAADMGRLYSAAQSVLRTADSHP